MPRISQREKLAQENARRDKNKGRLLDLLHLMHIVSLKTRFVAEGELVFEDEAIDSWSTKDVIGIRFRMSEISAVESTVAKGEQEWTQTGNCKWSIVTPSSDDYLFDEIAEYMQNAYAAEKYMAEEEAERKNIISSLTPRQRKILRV